MGSIKKSSREKHIAILWVHCVNCFLGFLLLTTPLLCDCNLLPFVISDWVSGVIIITFSIVSFSRHIIFAPWIVALAGIWLNLMPVLFYFPGVGSYINHTVIGYFIFAFALLIPGIPGKYHDSTKKFIPPGWSYNPSDWKQRIPVVICASLSWIVIRYLGFYWIGQPSVLGDSIVEYGNQFAFVRGDVSWFNAPESGIAAFYFTMVIMIALLGGEDRWTASPWIGVLYSILVVPLGILFIIYFLLLPSQIIEGWFFLHFICWFSTVLMILFSINEVHAVLSVLILIRRQGFRFWRSLFFGVNLRGTVINKKTESGSDL